MCVYLHAKFEASSIILTSFRLGGVILPPPPLPWKEPLKFLPKLGLTIFTFSWFTKLYRLWITKLLNRERDCFTGWLSGLSNQCVSSLSLVSGYRCDII